MVRNIVWCGLLLSLLWVLVGCEVDKEAFPLDYTGDRIVLNGYIGRERIELFVGKTQDPNAPFSFTDGDTLHQATVELRGANDSVWYVVPYAGAGNYVLDLPAPLPVLVDFYVYAKSSGLPDARSAAMPILEPQFDISAALVGVSEEDPTEFAHLTVNLSDSDPSSNFFQFYKVNRYPLPFEPFSSQFYDYRPGLAADVDETLEQQCGIQSGEGQFILPDYCFNGSSFTFPLSIGVSFDELGWDSLGFTIATTNEFLYRSLRSLDQPSDALEQLLFRPQLYLSNVTGGYGVVVTRNERVVWVRR